MQPVELYAKGGNSIKFDKMSIDKIYNRDLSVTSKEEMVSASTSVKGSAGYVAIEQVSRTLEGKKGTFVLQHFGIMKKGKTYLQVEIVPDSGTDELNGISGKMFIRIEDGEHYYDLEYQFAELS